MYGVSLMIMIFTTLSTALTGSGPATSAVGVIIFWRCLLGIGLGGDYPMSAVITAEFASTKYRGRMMAAVFSMQGVGISHPAKRLNSSWASSLQHWCTTSPSGHSAPQSCSRRFRFRFLQTLQHPARDCLPSTEPGELWSGSDVYPLSYHYITVLRFPRHLDMQLTSNERSHKVGTILKVSTPRKSSSVDETTRCRTNKQFSQPKPIVAISSIISANGRTAKF